MSLKNKLKAFEKTDRFKELVAEKAKTDPKFGTDTGGYNSKDTAARLGSRMKEILQNEVTGIKSSATGESFLDHILVEEAFVSGMGWVVNVSFDDDFMHRESLDPEDYPVGADLDVLFNEGYRADAYAFGLWHGEYIYSRKQRDALHFVQRAVERFNAEQKGKSVAQFSSKYSGGTL